MVYESFSRAVFHFHAFSVPTFAHYSVIRKPHWQIDETLSRQRQSMERFRNLTIR